MKTVAMLGAGSYGTAMANLLAHNGCKVKLWCRENEVAESIHYKRVNERYLPNILLHEGIEVGTELKTAICDVEFVFEAIPVKFLRSVIQQTTVCFTQDQTWVILSKGIENDTTFLPSQIIEDVFSYPVKTSVVAGPSFALDIAHQQITAVTIGVKDCETGLALQNILSNSYFRPYISLDTIGIQVGAALKNVIALGIGMLDGAGYKDNAKAFLLTRGLHEMVTLATILGGKQETLYGLSGVGDLVLTCMGGLSKNVAYGRQLGAGKTIEQLKIEFPTLPEGINTTQSIQQLIKNKNLDLPIFSGIYSMLDHQKSVEQFLNELMSRPLETECLK